MKEAIDNLCAFILENGGAGSVTAGAIENWFRVIRQAVISSNGKPLTPENAFYTLTEGMAGRFYREGITTPKLLNTIRKYCADYIRKSPKESANYLRPIRANNIVLPNTLLAQTLPELMNKGTTTINTGRKKSKTPLTERVNASFILSDTDGVSIEGKYTLFHDSVFCDFLSLALAGNEVITAAMIRRQQSQDFRSDISDATIKEYEEIIEELQRMKIKIDIREEAERRGWDMSKVDYFYRGRMMLILDTFEIQSGEKAVTAYTLREMPLLYEHALLSNQLITYSPKLRIIINPRTGKKYRCTTKRVEIQTYLLRQINNMKSDLKRADAALNNYKKNHPESDRQLSYYRKMSTHILFDTIFEKTGIKGSQNKVLLDYKSYIKDCLDNWGPNGAGQIKGFNVLHNGPRKDIETGVEIFLD